MDTATLAEVMGHTVSNARYAALTDAFNAAMVAADCTTVERAAMWCAQIGHESMGLRYMEELWGPTRDQLTYEGRVRDLGNNVPGDGFRFHGRGPIQITGRAHYANLSRWAYDNGHVPSPTFFVDQPAQLAGDKYGFLGCVWYWTVARKMNVYADRRDILGGSIAINGQRADGLPNNLSDRQSRWDRCLALGERILPSTNRTTPMADEPVRIHDQLSGVNGAGWPILGRSKVDPRRDNTLVEAVAEIRDALVGVSPSLVEPEYLDGAEPAWLDVPTFVRAADYQAFHAARLAEQTAAQVVELTEAVKVLTAALNQGGTR